MEAAAFDTLIILFRLLVEKNRVAFLKTLFNFVTANLYKFKLPKATYLTLNRTAIRTI